MFCLLRAATKRVASLGEFATQTYDDEASADAAAAALASGQGVDWLVLRRVQVFGFMSWLPVSVHSPGVGKSEFGDRRIFGD